jgi:uncharacterized Zn finger protein
MPCPQCSGRGVAFKVAAGATEKTITYRCEDCSHEWDVTVPEAAHPPHEVYDTDPD